MSANSTPKPAAAGLLRGRFSEATDEFVEAFTASVTFDQRLYRQDIQGSIAHAQMLQKIDVLKARECALIVDGLNDIEAEIEAGEFAWQISLEDVHMNIFQRDLPSNMTTSNWLNSTNRTNAVVLHSSGITK